MAIKCPKCQSENPDTKQFCGDCGTQLPSIKDIEVTETIEAPKKELARGTIFADRYEIIEELGKGGMGRVYRVEDKKTREELALKLIKPEISADKRTIERFTNELRLAHKISHRNVCRMYHLGEEKGAHYITMEYVPGEDLRSSIRRFGQLPIGKSISIANQICEGLAEAHRLGVVHRDLKSNNVMIDKDGNARIMDFGIARSLEAKGITGAGVMIGTPEYMSPEQVEGKEVDQRSDIYSLGIILYEMVTGKVPFEGDTPFTIGMKHKGEMPQDPKELNTQISDDLNDVILKCLEKEREKRYKGAREVRSELDRIEKGIQTTERIIPKRKPLTSREITVTLGLKKLLIPVVVVVAFIVAALIIWQLLPQKDVAVVPAIENSLAVISFENQTGDRNYDYLQKVIPSLLITNLEKSGLFYVVTWERMRDILKQMDKSDIEFIDSDTGFEICRREGVQAIILGSFTKAGNIFVTNLQVLDVETKKSLKSESARGSTVDSILDIQVDELSRTIASGLGVSAQKIEATPWKISDVTTSSLDAYNYYVRGKDEYERFNWIEARRFLEKAVELDPNFASGYRYLYLVNGQLGNVKKRDEYLKKALSLLDRISEKEKLFMLALAENERAKKIEIYQQITAKYPREKEAHYQLGFHHQGIDLNRAVEELQKAIKLDPDYGRAVNQLGATYIWLDDYEKGIECLKKYVSLSPGDANPLDSLGAAYFYAGNLDEALDKFKESLELDSGFACEWKIAYILAMSENYTDAMKWLDQGVVQAPSSGVRARSYWIRAYFHHWLGNSGKAFKDLDQAQEEAEKVGNESMKRMILWIKAWILYDDEALDSAIDIWNEYSDQYRKIYPDSVIIKFDTSFFLGMAEVKKGQIGEAKTHLDIMKSLLPEMPIVITRIPYYPGFCDILESEIMIAAEAPEKAVEVSEKTIPWSTPHFWAASPVPSADYLVPFLKDTLAKAHHKTGDIDKAIVEYEKRISFDPTQKDRALIHPLYHYGLADLYEQKGLKEKAIENYEKFLSLWKDADPGIAEVEDARERLAELKE